MRAFDPVRSLSTVLCLSVAIAGCGSDEPTVEPIGECYPMAVGNWWTYQETVANSPDVEELRYEVTGKETKTFDYDMGDLEVFVLTNTFPAEPLEKRIQYITDDGVRAERVQHLIYDKLDGALTKKRDFVPGFIRWDSSKLVEGTQWTEEFMRYTDTMDATDVESLFVSYDYTVLALYVPITVPAGTFDCVQLERRQISGTTSEVKTYYFAPTVGKVMEITEGDKTEALASYSVAPTQ